jgi:hypothetical protein
MRYIMYLPDDTVCYMNLQAQVGHTTHTSA